ncbi:1-deoxy-D-xylulose-5-phosphate reductoisomerase [bacterium]|nr:1-deoxy-D-xylulose-5-phosphate reductoisomerase [bacterium]
MSDKIVIFGITGSIGTNTERLVRAFPEKFEIIGCSAGKNTALLNEIVSRHKSVKAVAVMDEEDKNSVLFDGKIYSSEDGMMRLLDLNPDKIVMALPGKSGWKITAEAVKRGIKVCLANKESLVISGFYLGNSVTSDRSKIIPIDSEHAALMQLLEHSRRSDIAKIYITASGGALRDMSAAEMENADAAAALKHPVWSMGQKVTIDSATMLNKGLELFEAFWLFDLDPEKLDVLVHPSVNTHAALLFKDGSSVAQNAVGNMLVPIAAALSYPDMLPVVEKFPEMNFEYCGKNMTFQKPDLVKYPLLKTAFELLKNRDYSGMVAYAISDETAVSKFLKGEIRVKGIHSVVQAATERFSCQKAPQSIEEISEFIKEIEEFAIDIKI